MFKKILATTAILAVAVSAAQAQTPVVIYNNTTTFTGSAFANAGATSGTGPTTLVADDINTLSGFAGKAVTNFSFSIANFNTAAVSVLPTISFFQSNGTGSGPGTLITSVAFNAISQAAGSINVYNAPTNLAGYFAVPTSFFWAGITFASTTATTAQLNNIGQGIFNPPTVGSSQDVFFLSTAPYAGGSNPAGGFTFFNGAPVANFAWSFSAAPEPSQYAALGLGIFGIGALVFKARRRNAVA